ncbi:hypothetical protein GCM10022289_44840 [Pedobacter jeongneungensis]|uniref:CHAT domain-containing protein n=1 Tax=Pedobacter jeongneungensis TaxID=947309 RepID=A0ABP8BQA1_9SPHI
MSRTKIQYIIVQKTEADNIITANYNFEQRILDKLRYYPQDLLQFRLNFDYFNYVKTHDPSGMQVLLFSVSDLMDKKWEDHFFTAMKMLDRVCVFFFSKECQAELPIIISRLKKSKIEHFYYSLYANNELVNIEREQKYFMDYPDFFALLRRDATKLAKQVGKSNRLLKNIRLTIPESISNVDGYYEFRPLVSNVLNINISEGLSFLSHHFDWGKAPLENRQEMILESVTELDGIHLEWGKDNQINERWALPTLILVFPYHNPLFKKMLDHGNDESIRQILLAEQQDDYVFTVKKVKNVIVDEEFRDETANFMIKTQLENIDGICHLHSTFMFSPSIRFPIRSSIVNLELSHFGLGQKNGIRTSKTRHKPILKLGRKLQEVYLKPELEKYLSKRNGQILAISDLPIEWMLVHGVPLGFLCDVCRIQTSNMQGLLNNYSAYSKIVLTLGSKTVSNTLVIFSSFDEDMTDFKDSYNMAMLYQKNHGFKIAFAGDATEIKKHIQTHRPQILIFDCHCNYDAATANCYLQIGGKQIYPRQIVEHQIAAPIVYLASCNTNPNYDNIEKLHDAFFQSGALSVTGTFLPLDMLKGTFIYLRMLALLNSANERRVSGNWLHFLSFSIRTSLIWEARLKCYQKLNRELTEEEERKFISILERLHRFEDRAGVFNDLINQGIRLSDKIKLTLEDTNMEFMYYSHYGRPDLIRFKD